jgi:predicted amidophosphoribosyltransferase
MAFTQYLSQFLFGNVCLGCHSVTKKLDPWLCPDCREELRCLGRDFLMPHPDVICLYPMTPLTRQLIHALKYNSMPGLGGYLVQHSSVGQRGDALQHFRDWGATPLFLPVPLHSARFRERGYNQAEKIANALALRVSGRVGTYLKRRTFRVSQTTLSAKERELNVAGAFQVSNKRKLANTPFLPIVVDDVYTTGSTTNACLYALSVAGFPNGKVCTLIYEQPASAALDYVADSHIEWE